MFKKICEIAKLFTVTVNDDVVLGAAEGKRFTADRWCRLVYDYLYDSSSSRVEYWVTCTAAGEFTRFSQRVDPDGYNRFPAPAASAFEVPGPTPNICLDDLRPPLREPYHCY